jgi:hypothetical protein
MQLVDARPLAPRQIVQLLQASTEAGVAEVRAPCRRSILRPAPGEWCANEVVGHLNEGVRRSFGGRVHDDREHLTHIQAITQHVVYPRMGNAQKKSSDPNA